MRHKDTFGKMAKRGLDELWGLPKSFSHLSNLEPYSHIHHVFKKGTKISMERYGLNLNTYPGKYRINVKGPE